jgi:hypothetical protein
MMRLRHSSLRTKSFAEPDGIARGLSLRETAKNL